jgi:hypothetical protein
MLPNDRLNKRVFFSCNCFPHPSYNKKKTIYIGHISRKNCLVKRGLEGKTEGTRRRIRIGRLLLDGCKENVRYRNLGEKEIDLTFYRTRFGES